MKLFSKEKGIVLSILNAIFVIWIVTALVITISNITMLVIKDYTYTYEEYKAINCDFKYETEENCESNYTLYKIDSKNYNTDYKRNIIISVSNIVIVLLFNNDIRFKNTMVLLKSRFRKGQIK